MKHLHYKDSSLYRLFNLHDEKAKGRSVMLASSILSGIIGWLTGISILVTIGVILLIIGAVLWILGSMGRPVGGRRYWW